MHISWKMRNFVRMKDVVNHSCSGRFFVRMSRYVADWLRAKYMPRSGDQAPISMPWRAHPAGVIVYQRAVSNSALKKLTAMCYSAQMFSMDPGDVPEDRQADFPSDETMREFVPIALPAPHYYNGVWITDDETMQLDQSDTQKFNRVLLDEFWDDYDRFWADYQTAWKLRHPNRHCSEYDSMLDFMEFWHIDLDNEEALYRASKRRQAAAKANRQSQQ